MSNKRMKTIDRMAGLLLLITCGMALVRWPVDLWLTPDQQGDRLFAQQQYEQAAEAYQDPMKLGAAWYRAKEFEMAAGHFGRVDDATAAFNRGDALVMLGEYDAAIKSFERALQFQPEWTEARQNRDLAIARRDRLAPPDDDAGGTGGMLEADEIVFDDRAKNASQTEEVEAGTGQPLTDDALRLLWLQRVQTNPADFLKSKFAYQLSDRSGETAQ